MAEHTHADPGQLHFACPACYERALDDRRQAEIAAATRFTCWVKIRARARIHSVPVELGWPAGWPPKDVVHFYLLPEPWPPIRDAVEMYLAREYPDDEHLGEALSTLRYDDLSKGAPVVKVRPPDPMEGQPSLFG